MSTKARQSTAGPGRLVRLAAPVIIAVLLTSAPCLGSQGDTPPSVWIVLGQYGPVSFLQGTDGATTLAFGTQPQPPSYCAATVMATGDGNVEPFEGNYVLDQVDALTFGLACEGTPSGKAVALMVCASGRTWCNENVQLPGGEGQTADNRLPLQRDAGWLTRWRGDPDEMWVEDIQNVAGLGLMIVPRGSEARDYTVSGFELECSGDPIPLGSLSPVEQRLLERFGVLAAGDVSEGQRAWDNDADGMSDLLEVLAGTAWDDAAEIFAAEVESVGAAGITIRWPCPEDGTYALLRSASVNGTFTAVAAQTPDADELAAGVMTFTDTTATGPGPYFYVVEKQ